MKMISNPIKLSVHQEIFSENLGGQTTVIFQYLMLIPLEPQKENTKVSGTDLCA